MKAPPDSQTIECIVKVMHASAPLMAPPGGQPDVAWQKHCRRITGVYSNATWPHSTRLHTFKSKKSIASICNTRQYRGSEPN
jgi:hypothetical protein